MRWQGSIGRGTRTRGKGRYEEAGRTSSMPSTCASICLSILVCIPTSFVFIDTCCSGHGSDVQACVKDAESWQMNVIRRTECQTSGLCESELSMRREFCQSHPHRSNNKLPGCPFGVWATRLNVGPFAETMAPKTKIKTKPRPTRLGRRSSLDPIIFGWTQEVHTHEEVLAMLQRGVSDAS